MSLPPGTPFGNYQIVTLIGAGGMGEVYRAHDARLGRDVALKLLPRAFTEDLVRLRRFQQEVRILASLSHPNIVQIHDAGEQEGSPYLVMELLEGETLRHLLGKGRLPWRRAVELAAAMADGLAAAHAKGIVHRDLKPENIMVDEYGRPRLLDFGLAKQRPLSLGTATTVDTAEPGTQDGALLGTVGYMSPEQVQGLPLDARSDLFALGAVLYELVTGLRAFPGRSAVEVLSAILRDPFDPPSLSGSGGTPELDTVLAHCLEKDPRDRFQSAKDLAFALRTLLGPASAGSAGAMPRARSWHRGWIALLLGAAAAVAALVLWRPWTARTPPCDPRCAAILDFENRTGDPSLDDLGREIPDRLRQDLRAVENLVVATDPVPPAGKGEGLLPAAKATRCRFLAGGWFTARGRTLEFRAQVLDPWTGRTLYLLGPWIGTREDPGPAVGELRQRVAGALGWAITEATFQPGALRPPRLDALVLAQKAGKSGTPMALFEQALERDPDFFWARFCLVALHYQRADLQGATQGMTLLEGRNDHATDVERILTRYLRATIENRDEQRLQAMDELARIHPETPGLLMMRANAEVDLNRPDAAIRHLERIPKLAPEIWAQMKEDWAFLIGLAYHMNHAYGSQLRMAREVLALDSQSTACRRFEIAALAALGRVDEIRRALDEGSKARSQPAGNAWLAQDLKLLAILELEVHGHSVQTRGLVKELLAEMEEFPPDLRMRWRADRAVLLELDGQLPEALALWQELVDDAEARTHFPEHNLGHQACVLARMGRTGEARALDKVLGAMDPAVDLGQVPFHRACLAARLGEKERAVALLRKAMAEGMEASSFELHLDQDLMLLQGYPPYEALIKPRD